MITMNARYEMHAARVDRARADAAAAGREVIRPADLSRVLGISTQAVYQSAEKGRVDVVFRFESRGEAWISLASVRDFWRDRLPAGDGWIDDLRAGCVTFSLDGVVWNLLGERVS